MVQDKIITELPVKTESDWDKALEAFLKELGLEWNTVSTDTKQLVESVKKDFESVKGAFESAKRGWERDFPTTTYSWDAVRGRFEAQYPDPQFWDYLQKSGEGLQVQYVGESQVLSTIEESLKVWDRRYQEAKATLPEAAPDTTEQVWLKMFHNEYLPAVERRKGILTRDPTAKLTKEQESDAWFKVIKPIMDKAIELQQTVPLPPDFKGKTIEDWSNWLISQGIGFDVDLPPSLAGIYDENILHESLAAAGKLEIYQFHQDVEQKQIDVLAEKLGINLPPEINLREIFAENINKILSQKGLSQQGVLLEMTEDTLGAAKEVMKNLSVTDLNQITQQSFYEFMEKGNWPGMRGTLSEVADKLGMTTGEFVSESIKGVKEGRAPVYGRTDNPYYQAVINEMNRNLELLGGGRGIYLSGEPSPAEARTTAVHGMLAAEKGGRPEEIEAATETARQAQATEQIAMGGSKAPKLSSTEAWNAYQQVLSGFEPREGQYLGQFFNTYYSRFGRGSVAEWKDFLEKENLGSLIPPKEKNLALPRTRFRR